MRKLGPVGMKCLKITHIVFVALMFGGIISSVALSFGLQLTAFSKVNITVSLLVLRTGRMRDKFDVDLGATSVANFLKVALQEMTSVMYAVGKPAISQLNKEDLCCLDPWLARALHIPYAGVSPSEQAGYYQDLNSLQLGQVVQTQIQLH